MRRPLLGATAALALCVAISGCESSFTKADPHGSRACGELAKGLRAPTAGAFLSHMEVAGDAAAQAKTPQIRASVEKVGGINIADAVVLRAACVSQGVKEPPARAAPPASS